MKKELILLAIMLATAIALAIVNDKIWGRGKLTTRFKIFQWWALVSFAVGIRALLDVSAYSLPVWAFAHWIVFESVLYYSRPEKLPFGYTGTTSYTDRFVLKLSSFTLKSLFVKYENEDDADMFLASVTYGSIHQDSKGRYWVSYYPESKLRRNARTIKITLYFAGLFASTILYYYKVIENS